MRRALCGMRVSDNDSSYLYLELDNRKYIHVRCASATLDHPKAITRLVEVYQIESAGRRSTNCVHSVKLKIKKTSVMTKKRVKMTLEASWRNDEGREYENEELIAVFQLLPCAL